jgi:hypothetical protein
MVKGIQIPPQSSNIQSVSYDDETGDLFITFIKGNAVYRYPGVSLMQAEGFARSGLSAGAYFRANILNQIPGERVS